MTPSPIKIEPSKRGKAIITAALHADWPQVIGNGGPPCFHLDKRDGYFCLRAERWDGHKHELIHKFVSLADLLTTAIAEQRERDARIAENIKMLILVEAGEVKKYEESKQGLAIAAAIRRGEA